MMYTLKSGMYYAHKVFCIFNIELLVLLALHCFKSMLLHGPLLLLHMVTQQSIFHQLIRLHY